MEGAARLSSFIAQVSTGDPQRNRALTASGVTGAAIVLIPADAECAYVKRRLVARDEVGGNTRTSEGEGPA